MDSTFRRIIKRIVPRRLFTTYKRARGLLSLDLKAVERLGREEFFYNAFRALTFNEIDGDYLEFGCCGGTTFSLAYHASRRHGHAAKLWAFDSFCGLPAAQGQEDAHPVWNQGALAMSKERFHEICSSADIPPGAYTVVAGFYDQTLEKMSPTDMPTNCCLAYIDCDMYSSTKSVLQFLMPRLKHGMIIAFDDYYCWSPTQIAGERRAMLEFFEHHERWHLLPYMCYSWGGASFVVEDATLLRTGSAAKASAVD